MDRLPTELKGHIVAWLAAFAEAQESATEKAATDLSNIALCSRDFAALAQPFIFEVSSSRVVSLVERRASR